MWKLERTADFEKCHKHWPSKHRRELEAMDDNLNTYVGALNLGAAVEQIHFGFVHNEPKGIKAIDQKGAGAGVKQTRLYISPDIDTQIVHLIVTGDKSSQKKDIQFAATFVDDLGAQKGKDHGEK